MSAKMVARITQVPKASDRCLSTDVWDSVSSLSIACAHPRGSDHQPLTEVRMLWQSDAMHLRFDVQDRYVCCRHMQHQGPVCKDSCVEAFVQPVTSAGYFNFEFNIAGVIHASYITDPTRTASGFKQWCPLTDAQLNRIDVVAGALGRIDPEMDEPMSWGLTCRIPTDIMSPYVGPLTLDAASTMRGNFYKCADQSSHPHWLSWQPLGEQLNFHQPKYFGDLHLVL